MAIQRSVELLNSEIMNKFSMSIQVAADVLATDTWAELVNATQTDYREHGLVIGRNAGNNKLVRSKILEGYGREMLQESEQVLEAAFPVPMFPFGIIKGMSPRIKEDVALHTHPMPPEVDHVRTSIISDKDLQVFTGSKYNAMVMLDRGGAHLLARTRPTYSYASAPEPNLVSSTMREVIAESGGSMDVMARLAHRLGQYGLGYFYTPELTQAGDSVEFQNLTATSKL